MRATLPQVRVLFAGSRWWANSGRIHDELEHAWHDAIQVHGLGITLVVAHGHCLEGADAIAHAWALANRCHGVLPDAHPADWDQCGPGCPPGTTHRRVRRPGDRLHPGKAPTWCPGAGPRRNGHMVGLGAQLMLAAPDPNGPSTGTRSCMQLAARAGIPVRTITP